MKTYVIELLNEDEGFTYLIKEQFKNKDGMTEERRLSDEEARETFLRAPSMNIHTVLWGNCIALTLSEKVGDYEQHDISFEVWHDYTCVSNNGSDDREALKSARNYVKENSVDEEDVEIVELISASRKLTLDEFAGEYEPYH